MLDSTSISLVFGKAAVMIPEPAAFVNAPEIPDPANMVFAADHTRRFPYPAASACPKMDAGSFPAFGSFTAFHLEQNIVS